MTKAIIINGQVLEVDERITVEKADGNKVTLAGPSDADKPVSPILGLNSFFFETDTGDFYFNKGTEWGLIDTAGGDEEE